MSRLLYFFAFAVILSSCSTGLVLSKRQHRGGYHIEWVSKMDLKQEELISKHSPIAIKENQKEEPESVVVSSSSEDIVIENTIVKVVSIQSQVSTEALNNSVEMVHPIQKAPAKKTKQKKAVKRGNIITWLGGDVAWLYFYFGFSVILWFALKYLKDWKPPFWKKLLYYILFGALQAVFWMSPILAGVLAFSVGFTPWVIITGVCILLSIWLMVWVNRQIKKKFKDLIKGVINF